MTAVIAIIAFSLGWIIAWRYRSAKDTERLMTILHDLNWYRSAYRNLKQKTDETDEKNS